MPAGPTSWRDMPAGAGDDMEAGAPPHVRLVVGMARPRDRLATLQMFYPDAKAVGGDNYVYTDPSTKRPRLFNPKGLDLGDLPGITREALEVLGGAAGATLAAPSGPAGSVAGGALGATGMDAAIDVGRRLLGQPTAATPGDIALDPAKDLAINTAGELGGRAVQALPGMARAALASPEAARIADAARNIGVRPTVGMLSPALASTEHTLANVLPLSRAAKQQATFGREIQAAATNALPRPQMTPSEAAAEAGAALKRGADTGYARFRATRQRLDDAVYNAFPPDATVPVTGVADVATRLRATIAQAPQTFGPQLSPVLQRVQDILTDAQAHGGQLPLEVQRKVKTLIGQELETEATTQLTPDAQRWLKEAYRAMRDDLQSAAAAQSPQALHNLLRHDQLVRAFRGEDVGRESIAKSLDSILKANSDEAAYSALMSPSGGLNRIRQVLGRLDRPEREVVARAVWDRMLTTPQGNPNLNYLLGQWGKMNPAARRELFGRVTDVSALDDLMTVVGGMRASDRTRNFSNSGYTLIQAALGDKAISETVARIGAVVGGTAAVGHLFPTATFAVAASGYLFSEAVHGPAMARALAEAARGGRPVITESVRRSVARALSQLTARDLMAKADGSAADEPADPADPAASGWRAMPTAP